MNAEALVGTVLGTCTLQRLIGQGGMGAVFLAQQSRPRRQVAVKILMPMTPLNSHQLAAFLERFRRETDAAALLEHPNIMPVHEYGEQNGLAYLVMPYVSGGTLRDEMEIEGPLPLEKALNYVEQMAAALDFAHEHGVIHRDIKPANMMMTPEKRLLLTDFGLVKIIAGRHANQVRLTGEGAPVGTPDYMAPEQVLGEGVGSRADLYSLGVILYQMITGTTPFQGETPMQIAAQHLQIPPPSPHLLRPDLPIAAEQVILKALEKRPEDRYPTGRDLANAFRESLLGTGLAVGMGIPVGGLLSSATSARLAAMNGPFGPTWQVNNGTNGAMAAHNEQMLNTPPGPIPAIQGDQLRRPTVGLPAVGSGGLLSRATGMQPSVMGNARGATGSNNMAPQANGEMRGGGLLSKTGKFPGVGTGYLPAMPPTVIENSPDLRSTGKRTGALLPRDTAGQVTPSMYKTTGALPVPGQQGPNTVKLTNPMKVVQVPVAGQPGRFVTGLLPVVPATPDTTQKVRPWVKVLSLLFAALIVIVGAGGVFWYTHTHSNQAATTLHKTSTKPAGPPNLQATALAQATATFEANTILSDPLSTNTHNWLTTPADVYAFKNGAYHITDRGNNGRATVLQGRVFTEPVGYTLTMQEIMGSDTNASNSFGMIFRFNQQMKNNKVITTFYSFEVVNVKGGEYQFWKYDDSQANTWNEIWHQPFGTEFHQGHSDQSVNTVKIFANGSRFTITVNGKNISTVQDTALTGGTIGMIVNLNGTEVAFKNLLLTKN